jgi:uncharacterized membrane protein
MRVPLIQRFIEADYWIGYMSALIAWCVSFLMPIQPFLILILALVFSDLITGLMAARKRIEKITSLGLRRTVNKLLIYFVAILCSEGMRIVFLGNIPFTYFFALAISAAEFKSVLENVENATGVSGLNELLKKLLSKAGKK